MTHYTSIEQVKHLLELGLSPESTDMYYLRLKETNAAFSSVPFVKDETEMENSAYDALFYRIPCWSLGALLDVMPKSIKDEYDTTGCLGMCVSYNSSWGWIVYYSNADADCQALHEEEGNTLLEAVYKMICWLLENNYIKPEL